MLDPDGSWRVVGDDAVGGRERDALGRRLVASSFPSTFQTFALCGGGNLKIP